MKDEEYWYTTLPEGRVLDGIARGTTLIRPEESDTTPKKKLLASGSGPFGQLTLMGLLQMVSLGERLRLELEHADELQQDNGDSDGHEFVNQGRLFTSKKPLHPRRVQVMSTDFPRTIQSVQALLTGLFPDLAEAPIEIDVRNTNTYLIPDPQPRQSPQQVVLERNLSKRPHLLEREGELQELAIRITNALDEHLDDAAKGVSFGIGEEKDDEQTQHNATKPLPWIQLAEVLTCLHSRDMLPPSLSKVDVEAVSNHVAWRWFENLRHPVLAKAAMWKFADTILDKMKKKVNVECRCVECVDDGHSHGSGEHDNEMMIVREDNEQECIDEPWLCIYSAHDSTLIGLLCVLQLEQPSVWPEYGSFLKMELIREEVDPVDVTEQTQVLQHWVRFSLNGQILRSLWLTDENGEPASMVQLDKLSEMIHSEHELEDAGGDGGGLKFSWKDGQLREH